MMRRAWGWLQQRWRGAPPLRLRPPWGRPRAPVLPPGYDCPTRIYDDQARLAGRDYEKG